LEKSLEEDKSRKNIRSRKNNIGCGFEKEVPGKEQVKYEIFGWKLNLQCDLAEICWWSN